MKFEWDEAKNRVNIRKHGFDFADAWEAFASPMLSTPDFREDYGEDRWTGIGILKGRVIVLAFTERDPDTIRIISMRKAKKHERAKYEEEITN